MHHKYNKFLIVSFLIVSVLGVYSYFYNDLKSEAAVDEEGALSSSLNTGTSTTPTTPSSTKASEDTAFLMKLASLNRIKIDTSLFTDQSFQILVDNNIKLEPVPCGRINPFAPVESFSFTPAVETAKIDPNPLNNKTFKPIN